MADERASISSMINPEKPNTLVSEISILIESNKNTEAELSVTRETITMMYEAATGITSVPWLLPVINKQKRDQAINSIKLNTQKAHENKQSCDEVISQAHSLGCNAESVEESLNGIKEAIQKEEKKKQEITANLLNSQKAV